MHKHAKIWVAGHRGLVGSALVRALTAQGYTNLLLRTHAECDLERGEQVERLLAAERPECAVIAAAKVGGIHANNTYRAEFLQRNLAIALNCIHHAWQAGVQKLVFLGSSCIYPRLCPQPMREEHLLTGALESTNEPYAIAKIAGVKLVESYNRQHGTDYLSLMPTNLYGPNDNYDLENSHVLPALIRRFHEAKLAGHAPVTLWGTGSPLREFLHVDDLAEASIFALTELDAGDAPGDLYNVGSGHELPIRDLAALVQKVTGHAGEVRWDAGRPDGTPRKLLDCSRLAQRGWRARIALEDGLRATYAHYVANGR